VQHHEAGAVRLAITAYAQGFDVAETEFSVSLGDHQIMMPVRILPGENRFTARLDIEDPALWWPAGLGPKILA
jgi:hypothetical protein